MAYSLNRAQVIGNVTRDPEVRTTPSGQKVASFGVATNFTWTDQSGVKKEKAEFHNIVVWRKLAEICEQYLRKGRKVFIEGRLQTREWEGEDGVKRFKTEIIADNMILLDSRRSEAGPPIEGGGAEAGEASSMDYQQQKSTISKPKIEQESAQEEEVPLSDLPF